MKPHWPFFADPTDDLRPIAVPATPLPPDDHLARHPIPQAVRLDIAAFLYAAGARPRYSTDVAGNVTRGYGRVGVHGWLEYEL